MAPNGQRIYARLDEVYVHALIHGFTSPGTPLFTGEAIKVDASHAAVTQDGHVVYLDWECNEWPECTLTFVPTDPEDHEPATTWENNGIQFPRLIAELEAAAAFTPEVLDALSASMDLEPSEVHELIERAVISWDHIVRNTPAPAPAGE